VNSPRNRWLGASNCRRLLKDVLVEEYLDPRIIPERVERYGGRVAPDASGIAVPPLPATSQELNGEAGAVEGGR